MANMDFRGTDRGSSPRNGVWNVGEPARFPRATNDQAFIGVSIQAARQAFRHATGGKSGRDAGAGRRRRI